MCRCVENFKEKLKINISLVIIIIILGVSLIFEKTVNSKTALLKKIEKLENQILFLQKEDTKELDNEIINLISDNKGVEAVKLVREKLGFDLLNAKRYVDNIKDKLKEL